MKTQRGLSLVEVLIALTVGIVLLLGVTETFSTMRQTSIATQKLSAVQNQQRLAMYFLHVAVASAGYYPDPVNTTAATVFPASGSFVASQSLTGLGAGALADSISVRFVARTGGAEQGCSASLVAGDVYTDTFSVVGGNLQCVELDNTAVGAVASTVNLIAGVSGMSILYGVDTTTGGSATRYMTASQIAATTTPSDLWKSYVKTARITLQFANPLAGQPSQPQNVQLMETIPFMANI